jgi:hypothetical protein
MSAFEITYEPTPAFASSVYRAYLWHTQAGYIVSSFLLCAVAVWSLASGYVTEFWAFWLGVVATFWYGWLQAARNARQVSEIGHPLSVTFTVDAAGCTFRTPDSTAWLAWKKIQRVSKLKPAVILERRDGTNPIAIPAAALNDEQTALIVRYVQKALAELG